MKIYVLSKKDVYGNEVVCVSEDAKEIRRSICEDLDSNEDFLELTIWENGKQVFVTTGSDVLRKVAATINGF